MQVFKIDSEGFYLESIVISDDEVTPSDCVNIIPPEEFHKPKWTGSSWIEGLTPEEMPKTNVDVMGEQLVQERLERLKAKQQRDALGKEIVGIKLSVMQLKGGQTV